MSSDPYAHLKERAWREIAEIDGRLERGEIDEAGWHRSIAAIIVPAYLAAETPWQGSGKLGTAEDWEYSRSLIADAIDRDGTFLDVGCANGYLMECLPRWTRYPIEPYGLDIAPELASLARERLPAWSDRIWVGDALTWEPPMRFTSVRTGLEYVPARRRRDLVSHLLGWCDRLVIGVFSEQRHEHVTEELIESWGFSVTGRTERAHRDPILAYRCFWIDR